MDPFSNSQSGPTSQSPPLTGLEQPSRNGRFFTPWQNERYLEVAASVVSPDLSSLTSSPRSRCGSKKAAGISSGSLELFTRVCKNLD